jgi:hypothetical protein
MLNSIGLLGHKHSLTTSDPQQHLHKPRSVVTEEPVVDITKDAVECLCVKHCANSMLTDIHCMTAALTHAGKRMCVNACVDSCQSTSVE